MNLLKIVIPAVVLKKIYDNKYKNQSNTSPLSDDKKDAIQDHKDNN